MVEKVLGKTGAPVKSQEMMYKLLVQDFILYRIKIWLVMDAMMMVLEGFHHNISRQIVGMTEREVETAGNMSGTRWTRRRKLQIFGP